MVRICVNSCEICKREFDTPRGLSIHRSSCKRKELLFVRRFNSSISDLNVENNDIDIETVTSVIETDSLQIQLDEVNTPNLPQYTSNSPLLPNSEVNTIPGDVFEKLINSAYDEILFWRKNLFLLPFGKSAKAFINELSFWLEQFNKNTKYHHIALKVFMLLPNLLMQKPSRDSKAKEHNEKLSDRMQLWKNGDITTLLNEGRNIQKRIKNSSKKQTTDYSKVFAKLMMEGKVSAALKILSECEEEGVLPANKETIDELEKKHPEPAKIHEGSLLQGPLMRPDKSYFDSINGDLIKVAARQTKGSAGPSRLDSDQFKHILCSNRYRQEGRVLADQIALLAKKIATETVDPNSLEAYTTCRLIPLNKNPGVRPIGVGETLRRIIGKTLGWVLKDDIQVIAGPLQVATGLESGAEAAIHAMKEIFENEDCEAVILVDATNAFNSLNRYVALHNMQYILPQFAIVLINTYRKPARLIIGDGKEILSKEGTTQGDNLAMFFYALSTYLMQTNLRNNKNVKQVWLADDATGAGKIIPLKEWWKTLVAEGSKCGYYANASKSWVISKNDVIDQQAKQAFEGLGLKFTTSGKRHLGATIGSKEFRNEYVQKKNRRMVQAVKTACYNCNR